MKSNVPVLSKYTIMPNIQIRGIKFLNKSHYIYSNIFSLSRIIYKYVQKLFQFYLNNWIYFLIFQIEITISSDEIVQ